MIKCNNKNYRFKDNHNFILKDREKQNNYVLIKLLRDMD